MRDSLGDQVHERYTVAVRAPAPRPTASTTQTRQPPLLSAATIAARRARALKAWAPTIAKFGG